MAAYFESQCFIAKEKKVECDERFDIYSLGVLLWELTSRTHPFSDLTNYAIAMKISHDYREEVILSTPQEYADIYEKCWSSEPEIHPQLNNILLNLDRLILEHKKKQQEEQKKLKKIKEKAKQ
ncbi:34729_t:CDS:2, partial [Racocetra persica]